MRCTLRLIIPLLKKTSERAHGKAQEQGSPHRLRKFKKRFEVFVHMCEIHRYANICFPFLKRDDVTNVIASKWKHSLERGADSLSWPSFHTHASEGGRERVLTCSYVASGYVCAYGCVWRPVCLVLRAAVLLQWAVHVWLSSPCPGLRPYVVLYPNLDL